MTVKRNTFDIITTYELKTEVNIDNCSTDIGALESCSSAFLVNSLEKYMGGCLWNIWYTRAENFSAFWIFIHARMIHQTTGEGRKLSISPFTNCTLSRSFKHFLEFCIRFNRDTPN